MAEEDDAFISLSDLDSEDSIPMFFDKNRHICYLEMMLELLPSPYQSQEINRLTLASFSVCGLDILRSLDRVDKEGVINWVLSLQAHLRDKAELSNGQFYGFHGSRSSQFQPNEDGVQDHGYNPQWQSLGEYLLCASILKTLGYDFSLLDSTSIVKSMKNLHQPAISSMLENWSGIGKEKAKEYIINCQSYGGGFGLSPGSESHGGATFCAIASLKLMGLIEDDILSKNVSSCFINVPLLLDWSLQRQAAIDGGFQGRLNKATDACYAFWVGGVLKILGAHKFINYDGLRKFLFTCQSQLLLFKDVFVLVLQYGGFGKTPDQLPDLYHAYYGFCAFSMLEEPGLNSICTELGIPNGASPGL
ncbi:hypothetical protein RND71_025904 [Anisodus tanguticus]|uniref:Prenyltransferase alpha-alpha toroid domain-containing protein n=1 Tax=Anisodus tanguticus TaxID=243964 RepID=A0AAE1VAS7_9SOLA|nr:hypothetical protein RND71_025904 [Anisodus tanguticus]